MSLRSAVVSKHAIPSRPSSFDGKPADLQRGQICIVQGPSAIDFGIIPAWLYVRARFRQQRQHWPGWPSFEVFSEATAQGVRSWGQA